MARKTNILREAMRNDWNEELTYESFPYETYLQEELVIALQSVGRELKGIREALTEKEKS